TARSGPSSKTARSGPSSKTARSGPCTKTARSRPGRYPAGGGPSRDIAGMDRHVVLDQLVADRRPSPPLDRSTGGEAHPAPALRVGGERADRGRDRRPVERRDEQAGPLAVDQVERAAGGRRDHRYAAGQRLLHRLAERLERSSVDEHVEARVDARELVTPALAEEDRVRHGLLQAGPARAVADDDDADARQPAER